MTDSGAESGEFLSDTTARDNYRKAWSLILTSFWILVVITVIHAILRAPADSIEESVRAGERLHGFWGLFAGLYGLFLAGPLTMGYAWTLLRAARGEEVRIRHLFGAFERNYWNAVGAGLLSALIVIGGMLLLVVPGIIFACRLAFVPYMIVDRQLSATEAIRTSWSMTKGHAGTVFVMGLLAIPAFIAGAIALVVGIFVAFLWVAAAFAVLYHSVSVREGLPD